MAVLMNVRFATPWANEPTRTRRPLFGGGDNVTVPGQTACALHSIRAARSPMIAQGAWVSLVLTCGIIEASAMRSAGTS